MNKNVVGIILIVLAIALVGFYGYPKLKPYLFAPDIPAGEGMPTMGGEGTTVPI